MKKMKKTNSEESPCDDALKKSEEKYRNLYMSMMDGYILVDMKGQVVDSNATFQQMVGYNEIELASLTYYDLTPSIWHEYEKKIVREQILPDGHSMVYQKEYKKKDGSIFPVELRTFLVRNANGENEGMWAIVRDVTNRHMAEEALRKSEEKFRSIVECSPTAMYFYHLESDNRLILTGANPAADRIIGIHHLSLLGKTIEKAFPNLAGTEIPETYRKVARNELESQIFEIAYKDERFSGYYHVHVFRTGLNEIAVDFVDITNRKQMEEALRRS
ncbi:MAG: PAS domain S-box protein [Bacteroidetes bacterium]|nr:PAS domain S-box protein [Bacteroidota bacterium]